MLPQITVENSEGCEYKSSKPYLGDSIAYIGMENIGTK
jgi:hypothetical protein